ncbi:hypothetical protein IFM89_027054 [Coptis chinensis]|uniref:Bifunctional inhibitor/plant lipid transfer protein/seed storage helical domain-containing protein n=1 Tax=Coptis chinensis TaxID=261450 RepID=A0A835HWR2_9MAGN|nr:hypothetical protein IFM89_027054 [Coptis chinensis]
MKMRSHSLLFSAIFLFCYMHGSLVFCASPSVTEQCRSEFSKVGDCLSYATGKADSPTNKCCTTVKDIKDKNPVCLCFIIQQAHDGASSFKQMGLQEAKLLQLPTACNLVNANISDCPKLLNLAPNSPDMGIFTNSTKSSPATPATPDGTPLTTKGGSSMGFKHAPLLANSIAVSIFVTMIIMGFSSTFSL